MTHAIVKRAFIFIISLLSIANIGYAQENPILVIDSISKEAIPFYSVNCGSTFYNGNLNGYFKPDTTCTCIISRVGYYPKNISISGKVDTIKLRAKTYNLKGIIVNSSDKNIKTRTIGPVNNFQIFTSDVKISYNKNFRRGSLLTLIKNDVNSIGKIKYLIMPIKTNCKHLFFRIRIFSVDSSNKLGRDLLIPSMVLSENRFKNKIDVSRYNITFPKKGIFIGFDWYYPEAQDVDPESNPQCKIEIPKAKNIKNPIVYFRIGSMLHYDFQEYSGKFEEFILIPKWGVEIIPEKTGE